MSDGVKIAIDAMGGENSPKKISNGRFGSKTKNKQYDP